MLDTNVIISIMIFNSDILKKMLEIIIKKYKLVISTYVLEETKEVIKRKFSDNYKDFMDLNINKPEILNPSEFLKKY